MTFPLSNAANQFAIDFYHCFVKRHGSKHKNLIICPYLIFQSLAMLLVGAKGSTADQLYKLLHIPKNFGQKQSASSSSDQNKSTQLAAPSASTLASNSFPAVSPAAQHRQTLEQSIERLKVSHKDTHLNLVNYASSNASSAPASPSSNVSVSPPASKITNGSKKIVAFGSNSSQKTSRSPSSSPLASANTTAKNDTSALLKSQKVSRSDSFAKEGVPKAKSASLGFSANVQRATSVGRSQTGSWSTSNKRRRFICDPGEEARHNEMLMLTEQLLHGNHEFVHLASFIYLDKKIKRTEQFKSILCDFYETKPKKIDFSNPKLMVDTVNQDVARTTENIYNDILPLLEAQKCEGTNMLLVNAVFFRGFWQSNFTDRFKMKFTKWPSSLLDETKTPSTNNQQQATKSSNNSLYIDPNNNDKPKAQKTTKISQTQNICNLNNEPMTFEVEMMSKFDYLPVVADKELDAKIVRLPFEASDLQMLILLPNNLQSDSTYLCRDITAEKISAIARAFLVEEPQYVRITLPIFCVDSGKISIQSTLVKMGARDLFDQNKADMSGLNALKTPRCWLNKILHRCFIINDNRGAITSSGIEIALKKRAILEKASKRQEIIEFTADHPFLYIIMDSITKTILLIGQYTDPRETLQVINESQLTPEEAHQIYTDGVYSQGQ